MIIFAWIHSYNPHIQLKYYKLNSRELIVVSRKSIVWREKWTVTSRELANSLKQPFCLLSFQLEVKLSPSPELDFLTDKSNNPKKKPFSFARYCMLRRKKEKTFLVQFPQAKWFNLIP